jgi:D-cysteine desulfhydrase
MAKDFDRLGFTPEYVVCAVGSGGTFAGLSLGFHLLGLPVRVLGIAVCDSKNYFIKKSKADVVDWIKNQASSEFDGIEEKIDWLILEDYIGQGYSQASQQVLDLIANTSRDYGLLLDPVYTGKAYQGMASEMKSGILAAAKNVVFLHTGGVFGLLPWAECFDRS